MEAGREGGRAGKSLKRRRPHSFIVEARKGEEEEEEEEEEGDAGAGAACSRSLPAWSSGLKSSCLCACVVLCVWGAV